MSLVATILGYALHGNPHLQRQVLDSALAQFPVIGGQVTATVAFKVLTARSVTTGQIRAGAVAAAVTWQALQWAGTLLIGHELKGATATYG
ncbi:MAG TPA: hypothetical protein VGG54_18735 [Trebonia sp.]|jgi:uncharacterized BrkB/YihY/UPF0761 family membrane protein